MTDTKHAPTIGTLTIYGPTPRPWPNGIGIPQNNAGFGLRMGVVTDRVFAHLTQEYYQDAARCVNANDDLVVACVTALGVLDTCTCNHGHERLAADRIRAALGNARKANPCNTEQPASTVTPE